MTHDERFHQAMEDVKRLKKTPTGSEEGQLYGLCTLGVVGNVVSHFRKMKARGMKNVSPEKDVPLESAKEAYIKKVQELIDKYGLITTEGEEESTNFVRF